MWESRSDVDDKDNVPIRVNVLKHNAQTHGTVFCREKCHDRHTSSLEVLATAVLIDTNVGSDTLESSA